ncbi:putative vacuolar protein sorting-associated protein 62 [Tanacetum coccineum]
MLILLSNAYALENVKEDAPVYPQGNLTQPSKEEIRVLMTVFAPLFYFHPQEEFFPSSVIWFFDNGAMVFDPSPRAIINNGEDLPRNGTVDDAHLDLPADKDLREKVKRGSVADAVAYIHAKPSLGGTYTDLVIWLFYPFNGGSAFQFGKFTFSLGIIGERVGDWEHVTLRVNNYQGVLNISIPTWKGQMSSSVGLVDDAAKSDNVFDMLASPSSYELVSDDNGVDYSTPPPWLDYTGRWGPKVSYKLKDPATAEEMDVAIGEVGYSIRFEDVSSDKTVLK